MKKKVYLMLVFCIFCVLAIISETHAQASTFRVKAERSAHQISENSYFDLLLQANQQEELFVVVSNDNEKDIQVGIHVDSARTTSELAVDYGNKMDAQSTDDSLAYDLKELLTLEKEQYTVAAKGEIKIPLKLTMPTSFFEGVLAGGIVVTQLSEAQSDDTQSGLSLGNQVAYEIAVLVRETEKIDLVETVSFKDFEVKDDHLALTIQNPVANFINEIAMTVQLKNKKSGAVLYSEQLTELQLAPNTNAQYQVPFPEPMVSGDYILEIEMKDYKENNWSFEKEFSLDKQVSSSTEEVKERKDSETSSWKIWLILAFAFILLVLVIYLVYRQRNLQKKFMEMERTLQKKAKKSSKRTSQKKRQ